MVKQLRPERVIKEKEYDEKYWNRWEREGGWRPVGYRIVEVEDGASLNELEPRRFMIVHRPHGSMFHHSYGRVSKFFEGILEGKLYGTKCPKCGLVYCPPRAHCFNPDCKLEETNVVELPKHGVVHSWTVMAIAWPALAHMQPLVGAMVRIDGTNTCLPMILTDIDPEKVDVGLKVKINIVEEPKGDLLDVFGTPAEEPTPPKRTPEELERFRKDMQMTKDWVKKKFGTKK